MIVGCCYLGDNTQLSKAQQDVYHHALRKIIDGCRTHYARACTIAATERSISFDGDVDHRTIQRAHDVLAAAWRFAVAPVEPSLGLNRLDAADTSMSGWLAWLEREIDTWAFDPDLLLTFLAILANQNQDAGYEAEKRLAQLLLTRFDHVPWSS